jgi:peptidoglycan/LPS O-acetylase OafA/YrhL
VLLINYRPDIDGLRAVAVLAVVLHHLSSSLVPGGYIGVDVFFVISGYLITRIINREIAEGSFTFIRFYERRARRIFPALFAMLAATLIASYFLLLPSDYASTLRGALGTIFFSSNIVFWRDMSGGYFAATDAMLNPLLHTWSLAVEEQFYVFFPILLLLCLKYFRQHIVLIFIACAVVSLAGAALLVNSKSVAVFFLSPFRAWELLVGALLAANALPVIRSRVAREIASGVGLLAILAASFLYSDKTTFPGLTALAPVLGAAAIIHAGASGPSMAGRLLTLRPVVYIGLISYSLYLWHWPLIVLARYSMGMAPLTPYIPIFFALSLLLGSLSYHFIEQPFRRGSVVTRKVVFASSGAFAVLFGLISVGGLMSNGFAMRFDQAVVELDKARAPLIPYVECDERSPGEWCLLGNQNAVPGILLWGDSHMLAWAPALNESLTRQGANATFAPLSACPPFFGAENSAKLNCHSQNLAIKRYLLAHPEIQTVVMAAYWNTYFRNNGPLTIREGDKIVANGTDAARDAMHATLGWLRDNGRQVILIGPVPVYDKSVPFAQALEVATNSALLHSTAIEQRSKHGPFLSVVQSFRYEPWFRFLDPIQWMCSDECVVMKAGVPLYRDSHHLSVAGAMALEVDIGRGLASFTTARNELDKVVRASTANVTKEPSGKHD